MHLQESMFGLALIGKWTQIIYPLFKIKGIHKQPYSMVFLQ